MNQANRSSGGDQGNRREAAASKRELKAPASELLGETRPNIILEIMKNQDRLADKQLQALNHTVLLNQRLERNLERFDVLLEQGVKVVSLFSQKVLEKEIHEAMKELEQRGQRSELVDRKRRERWRKS